jgi:hypothetical protein
LTKLSDLGEVEKDSILDVVGILKDVGEIGEIITKINQKTVRILTILFQGNSIFNMAQ